MDYRFLRLTTTYLAASETFEQNNLDDSLSYEEMLARYVASRFAESDVFSFYLRQMGRDAQDVFASAGPLQRAWAREHGRTHDPESWHDTVVAQVHDFDPDVLYIDDLYTFDPPRRGRLRDQLRSNALMAGWRAAPTHDYKQFRDLDVVFSAGQNFVDALRDAGVPSYLFPLAFDPRTLEMVPERPRDLALTFMGSVGEPRDLSFASRRRFIEEVMKRAPLEVWDATPYVPNSWVETAVYAANQSLRMAGIGEGVRRRIPFLRRGWWWQSSPQTPRLKEMFCGRVHKACFGLEYLELLRRSQITLNFHTSAAGRFGGNLRMYEATGMGACLVTDWKENLPHLFEPDKEVVYFRDVDECLAKIDFLLNNVDQREEIALAGQQRTLRDHTWSQRIEEFDQRLIELLTSRRGR